MTNLSVVIVDDHALFRNGLHQLLTSRDIDVVGMTGNPTEAIDLVAVVKRSNENKMGEELVAFVIYHSSASGDKETINSIIQLCKKNLPPYMIPREIYELETMPLNNSEKIDRLKLEGLAVEYLNTK